MPSHRLAARLAQTFRPSTLRQRFSTTARARQNTDSAAAPGGQSAFAKFLHSEVGPKTVHFWAPIMKWGVVLSGVADFARPASSLSIPQNAALIATGVIWTRWCFVIKPRNLFLASVNFLLFCVGATQVSRALLWQRSQAGGGGTGGEVVEKVVEGEGRAVQGVKEEIRGVKEEMRGVLGERT